jgi:hypothetical protein
VPARDNNTGTGNPAATGKPEAEPDLDEALAETFPASDPLACTPRRAGRSDHKLDHPAPSTEKDRKGLLRRIKDRLH